LEEYLEKIQKINYELKSKKFYYSLLRIGLIEAVCFLWKGEPNLSLRKIKKLERLLSNLRSSSLFPIYFNLLISKGIAYTLLMKINIANKIAYVCSKILKNKKYVSPYYFENLGTLYMNLEKFKKAEYYFLKCLDKVEENINKNIKGGLAMISLLKGDYEKARIMATDAEFGEWSSEGWNLLFYSLLFLIKGMPQKTISYCLNALSLLKQQELGWGIVASFLTMAFCYSGLGEKKKAINILKDVIPFLHEKKLKRILPVVKILITKNYSINKNVFPTIKLLLLLKNYGYRKAFIYAKKNYLLTYFYRYLLFFPEKVNKALQRGEKVEIPKTLLKFPVFNKNYLTFNIQFLSPFKIYRNHKLMKIKLSLREKAFLIYLSQKLKEPEDSIIVEEIYKNFWSHSLSPRRNFSRIFLKIRQKLKIPFNFFNIKKQKENPILLNKRIYFRTDLDEFNEKISKGKIFLRIGKNKNAKKEFLRAFSLIKCKPFEKMYDRFSEDKRTEIIFKINDAFKEFLKTNPSKEEIEKIKKRFEKLKIFITF
ncbi:MAG: tetratricopeptide repeat protein, partial [Candidatus Aenigmatarchaeota archaeon]